MTGASGAGDEGVTRITRLKIEGFRGFVGATELDTDADIVLLAGPNGYGKTSLLEALLALLTGHHYHADPVHAFNARSGKRRGARIEAQAKIGGQDGETPLAIGWDANGNRTEGEGPATIGEALPRPEKMPRSRLEESSELRARLSAFFQERMEKQYDEATTGTTVREVLEPEPPLIKAAREALGGEQGDGGIRRNLADAAEALRTWKGRSKDVLQEELRDRSSRFNPLYNRLAARVPGWPRAPEIFTTEADLFQLATAVVAAEGLEWPATSKAKIEAFDDTLRGKLKTLLDQARTAAYRADPAKAKLREELEETDTRIARIRDLNPNLERKLAIFGEIQPGDPNPEAIFRALARYAEGGSRIELPGDESGRLAEVLEEFGRVDPVRAGVCAGILATWFEPLWKARRELDGLETRREELRRELELARISEEMEALLALRKELVPLLDELCETWGKERKRLDWEQDPERETKAAKLEAAKAAVDWLLDRFQEDLALSGQLLEQVRKVVQGVVERFSLVEGFLPLKVETAAHEVGTGPDAKRKRLIQKIVTADGRGLAHYSTGQKGQVAVGLLVAQNWALGGFLNHRLLLLDDVSAAYDFSNLTREALLWRQLAYGYERTDRRSRQVFISSHHEDLTNHLLELLVPPAGRSLRLLRFTGWSQEHGPTIEPYALDPTAPAGLEAPDSGVRQRFAQALSRLEQDHGPQLEA